MSGKFREFLRQVQHAVPWFKLPDYRLNLPEYSERSALESFAMSQKAEPEYRPEDEIKRDLLYLHSNRGTGLSTKRLPQTRVGYQNAALHDKENNERRGWTRRYMT